MEQKYMSIHKASIEEISMLQLSDSFFPSGMYTTSSGLEALYYSNSKITDANQLRDLIKVYLEHQIGLVVLSGIRMNIYKEKICKN
jgi:urease accessory protein UreF